MSNFDVLWLRVKNIGSEREDLAGFGENYMQRNFIIRVCQADIIRAMHDGHIKEEMMRGFCLVSVTPQQSLKVYCIGHKFGL
jgi:hypothetical protein